MESWQEKAHRIIAALSRESWAKVNILKNGRQRKKHVPYTIPEAAADLVECLKTNDEERAKAMFVFNYEVEIILKGKIK